MSFDDDGQGFLFEPEVSVDARVTEHEYARTFSGFCNECGKPERLHDRLPPDPVTANTVGLAHARGQETERTAARRNAMRSGSQRVRVLTAIVETDAEGSTDYELEVGLGMKRPSPGNRRGELVTDGFVEKTDRKRPTDTGSPAVVWVATELGRSWIREHPPDGR